MVFHPLTVNHQYNQQWYALVYVILHTLFHTFCKQSTSTTLSNWGKLKEFISPSKIARIFCVLEQLEKNNMVWWGVDSYNSSKPHSNSMWKFFKITKTLKYVFPFEIKIVSVYQSFSTKNITNPDKRISISRYWWKGHPKKKGMLSLLLLFLQSRGHHS